MILSIIVPVYNVEKYLDRCIDSLVNQNIEDYEIIIINDGSTDNTKNISLEYANKYSFIKLINQNNKGLSVARNTGILNALGKYLMFIDSDDFIEKNCLSQLVECMEKDNLDVGIADFKYINENNEVINNDLSPIICEKVITGKEFFKRSLQKRRALMMVWKSVYRRELILDNLLFFLEGYNHEDEEWTPKVYLCSNRVKTIECIFYYYYLNNCGISKLSSKFKQNAVDIIKICYMAKDISNTMDDNELKQLFQNNTVDLFLSAFYKGKLLQNNYSDIVKKDFFKNMYVNKKNKYKVKLFSFNKYLYYYINYCLKKLKK